MLLKKIKSKKVNVLIAGCGYTGYPLADLISKQGIKVVGYDINSVRVDSLKRNIDITNEVTKSALKKAKSIRFTSESQKYASIDMLIVRISQPDFDALMIC